MLRLGLCPGKAGKPSVVITKDFHIYLGNPSTEEMVVTSCDILGFYTGAYEIKIVKSGLVRFLTGYFPFSLDGPAHSEALDPWRNTPYRGDWTMT